MKNRPLAVLLSLAGAMLAGRSSFAASSATDLYIAATALRKADADWAAAASTGSVEAWLAFYAADAMVLLPNDQLVSGRDLVRQSVAGLLALPRLSVSWHSANVEVAKAADLAYLRGTYELRFGDARGGALLSDRGRTVEIWRKQADGSWKCIVDIWNSDDSAAAPSIASGAAAAGAGPSGAPAGPLTPTPTPTQGSMPMLGPGSTPAQGPTPAQAPTPAPATKYGEMPAQYQEAIRQYFKDHLKDPDSVQYQNMTTPETGSTASVSGGLLMRETRDYGWKVKATINAKNSRGSYSGFKTYTFLFRGEKIIHALAPLPGDEMN